MTANAPPSSDLVRILIVEDVAAMRQLLSDLLGSLDGVVVSAAARNTWEARLAMSRHRPDLVLLDVVLPGESGLDLLPELEALGIPVFLISEIEESTRPLPRGVLGRLDKPRWESRKGDLERFRSAIEQHCGKPGRKPAKRAKGS